MRVRDRLFKQQQGAATMKIKTTVNTIKALLLTAGKKDVRYYLNSIHIDIKKVSAVLVSTDGYRLTAIDTFINKPEGFELEGVTLPRAILESFVKSATGDVEIEILDKDNTKLSSCNGVVMDVSNLECRYPEWRRVLDIDGHAQNIEQAQGMPVNCNLAYLTDLAKIYKLLANKPKATNYIIWHNLDNRKIMMTMEDNIGFLSIIMGMDYTKTEAPLPSNLSSTFKH